VHNAFEPRYRRIVDNVRVETDLLVRMMGRAWWARQIEYRLCLPSPSHVEEKLTAEPSELTIPVELEAEPIEPKFRYEKLLVVLKGLQVQNKLGPDMKPAAVERVGLRPFRKRWPGEPDPHRRSFFRVYLKLYPRPPSK
jgi:hypothetical protein